VTRTQTTVQIAPAENDSNTVEAWPPSVPPNGIQQWFVRRVGKLREWNLFKNYALPLELKQGYWSTRLYCVLLLIGIVTLSVYTSVTQYTISVTVDRPSRQEFLRLKTDYPVTLSCTCSNPSVHHGSFISLQTRLHQICSSPFIDEKLWLSYFIYPTKPNTTKPAATFYALDFRFSSGPFMFRQTRVLCELAAKTIATALAEFNETSFFSTEPLSEQAFNEQTTTVIEQFKAQVPIRIVSQWNRNKILLS
jgi:hypothetical protein